MTLFQKSVILFICLILLVILPSLYFTVWTAGFALIAGSAVVIWQTFIILTDEE